MVLWPTEEHTAMHGRARPNSALVTAMQEFVARSFDFLRETRNKDLNKIS